MWRQFKVVTLVTMGIVLSAVVLTFAWANRHLVEIKAWGVGTYKLPIWGVLGLGLLLGLVLLLPLISVYALRMQRMDMNRKDYINGLKQELDMLRNQPLLEDDELVRSEPEPD